MAAPTPPPPAAQDWIGLALDGHRASLARAITAIEEDNADAPRVLAAAYPRVGRALVVGFTGAPGAGKSTLVAACIATARARGLTVGVLAIDPSSPHTGGAVLGDRIRMLAVASDTGVYVRSLAARGHLGGLSAAASRVVDVLDAAGKNLIIVETVGVGQSETEVSGIVHLTVLVCAPGMGDDVQMIKAGVLETADVFAVNKADLPEAQGVIRQLRAASHLAPGRAPPVVATVATTGQGTGELLDILVTENAARVRSGGDAPARRQSRTLAALAGEEMRRRIARVDGAVLDAICTRVLAGQCGFQVAIDELLRAAAAPADGGDRG